MNFLSSFRLILLFSFILFLTECYAQDSYHSNLQSELQNTYGLPMGNWVLNDTEIANLNADFSYGNVNLSNGDASGQEFSKKISLEVTFNPGPQWNTGYGLNNASSVDAGDRCLLVVWFRSIDEKGKASVSIQNSMTFENEYYLTFPVVQSWNRYLIPFEISNNYDAGELQFVFQPKSCIKDA